MMEHVEQIVCDVIAKVAGEKKLDLEIVLKTQKLVGDIGFKSIDLARIIAVLEFRLGVDPFSTLVPITDIQTVGDICKAYRLCFSEDHAEEVKIDFQPSKDRAEARLSVSRQVRGELRKNVRSGQ